MKFTHTEGNRYFVTAEFAPGTVQVRPTMDATARLTDDEFVVIDGPGQIGMQKVDAIELDTRGIFEFDLRALPAGAVIDSVTLEMDTSSASTSTMPQLQFYGYGGDGYAAVADAIKIDVFVGESEPVDDLDLFAAAINPQFVQSLLGNSDFLGLLALGDPGGTSIAIHSNEAGAGREPPLLTIAYTLPGDYDRNGVVEGADYDLWKLTFGSTTNLAADGNGDQIVNAADYTVWRNHLAFGGGSSTRAVPEPTTLALLGAFIMPALAGRRFASAVFI
jgi:hypothetical protein